MAKYLVILESPAKAKTVKKILGKNYEVMASNGHVRDLPKSQMGIDIEHDFEPKYITIRGKGEVLSALRKETKKAEKIYLATDPDREGEAIAWHLSVALGLTEDQFCRISFNEITKSAVKAAIKNPRKIDMNLVDAQQARRVLDRIVGYEISPVLWAKVKRGLSAGRVQSVALRMVCDREEEIAAFLPEEYWSLSASLCPPGEERPLFARLISRGGQKVHIADSSEADALLRELSGASFTISEIKTTERRQKSPLAFTTSTLQQEANNALGFSIAKTMQIAQQLYEGVDIKGLGTIGLITYLRTDSVRISEEANEAALSYIADTFGSRYAASPSVEKAPEGAQKIQDAHEAIRPSDVHLSPSDIKDSLTRDQFRLYQLIWKRFVASRMSSAVFAKKTVGISAGDCLFSVTASSVVFDGFRLLYTESGEEKEEQAVLHNSLQEGDVLTLAKFAPRQHFTQPPAHFTEATLVSALEERGIGRPSTYSPTITTILSRHYITKEKKSLYVTEMGEIVNRIMKESFPVIVDEQFTANMEYLLDGIAEGKVGWKSVIENFYPDLQEAVDAANRQLTKVKILDEPSDVICENCGRRMVYKIGPHGKFLACPGFPECRNTKPYYEKIGVACPDCGADLVMKKTRKGRIFYGCSNPDCDFMRWSRPVEKRCPLCGSLMVQKGSKIACEKEGCGYSEPMKEEEEA